MNGKDNPKYRGDVIKVAYNPLRKRYEQVFPEDELGTSFVITLYWATDCYVTIPGRD